MKRVLCEMVTRLSELIDADESLSDEAASTFYASEDDTAEDSSENSSFEEIELQSADIEYNDSSNIHQDFLRGT